MKKPVGIFLADIHWRTNTPVYRRERGPFQDVIAAKLRAPLVKAATLGIPVFVAGDVFDRSREFMDMWTFREFLKSFADLPVIHIVPGQHDRFHHNKEEAATSLNAAVDGIGNVFVEDGEMRVGIEGGFDVWFAGWGGEPPKPEPDGAKNILVTHKTLWHKKPVYPGQKDGNVATEGAKLKKLGYDYVFSGDNHIAFDTVAGGVEFHNLGAFTRDDVTLRNQRPRYCVLYDDGSVESEYVGEEDVFDLERSDADKGRDERKDEFSSALAGGFERGQTFKGGLQKVSAEGRCGDAALNERQGRMLKDVVNAI